MIEGGHHVGNRPPIPNQAFIQDNYVENVVCKMLGQVISSHTL